MSGSVGGLNSVGEAECYRERGGDSKQGQDSTAVHFS